MNLKLKKLEEELKLLKRQIRDYNKIERSAKISIIIAWISIILASLALMVEIITGK